MSKKLSNGVMSLKFMQNAQRAKQQAQVELEQAKIKDEAEWEVSQEVKEAWGIGSSSSTSTSAVVHEASYLPFIFSSFSTESFSDFQVKPKGRRSFNTKGKEVEMVPTEAEAEAPEQESSKDEPQSNRRLTSISGFKAPLPARASSKAAKGVKTKTVQELIREDLGKQAPAALRTALDPPPKQVTASPSTGFLKPSGVDAPATFTNSRAPKSHVSQDGASTKKKRHRDEAVDSEGKKRKKKTSGSDVRLVE